MDIWSWIKLNPEICDSYSYNNLIAYILLYHTQIERVMVGFNYNNLITYYFNDNNSLKRDYYKKNIFKEGQGIMGKDIRTRSGLNPDRDDTIPYSIDTSKVEEFIQNKFDIISKKLGEESPEIRVLTTEAGERFLPFMIVLPVSVTKAGEAMNKLKNCNSVFYATNEENDSIKLKDWVFKLLQQYAYTTNDRKMFDSQSFRQQMRIFRRSAQTLKSFITPKKMKLNGNNEPKIIMLLDPLKVFYDMLGSSDDSRPYHVEIPDWKKIETGKFRYRVERVINRGKKKNYKDTMASELNNFLRGARK